MLLAATAIIGMYNDAWGHNNEVLKDTFFTKYHAILYTGFACTLAWILWQLFRLQDPARLRKLKVDWKAIPAGYGIGLVGLAMVSIGGIGDMIWHTLLGVEAGIDSPFSPPHQTLFFGGALVASIPLRAAWLTRDQKRTFLDFLPVLISLAFMISLFAYAFMYQWAFVINLAPGKEFIEGLVRFEEAEVRSIPLMDAIDSFDGNKFPYHYYTTSHAIGTILLTNILFFGPILAFFRRWRAPFGTVTMTLTIVAVLTSYIADFRQGELILAAVVGGLIGDVLVRWLRPWPPSRMQAFRAAGVLLPVSLWSAYFLAFHLFSGGLGWSVVVWAGVIVMTGMMGWGLSILIAPPVAPWSGDPPEPAVAVSHDGAAAAPVRS